MIASRLAHIPLRIYQLHGLRLETATGWRRRLFLLTERSACWCSQKVLCVSRSLKNKVVELGVCESQKLAVLGSGSCAGIHLADYAPTPERLAASLVELIGDERVRETHRQGYDEAVRRLAGDGASPSLRAADQILELIAARR